MAGFHKPTTYLHRFNLPFFLGTRNSRIKAHELETSYSTDFKRAEAKMIICCVHTLNLEDHNAISGIELCIQRYDHDDDNSKSNIGT